MRQGLVVGEQRKLPPFQHETEVMNSRVSSQELSVEGGVFGLGRGMFFGEESQRRPGASDHLLEDCTNMGVQGVYSKGNRSSRLRVSKNRD